ncbi:unnamed protein product, partial [Rotaria sp. Silwood2]
AGIGGLGGLGGLGGMVEEQVQVLAKK